jgi:hypothetical protein
MFGSAWTGREGYVTARELRPYDVKSAGCIARAEKVRRALAIACSTGLVPSFTKDHVTGIMRDIAPDRWRTDNLRPRFLMGQIKPTDIASSAFAGRSFYPVFLAEKAFETWVRSEAGEATEAPTVAFSADSASKSATEQAAQLETRQEIVASEDETEQQTKGAVRDKAKQSVRDAVVAIWGEAGVPRTLRAGERDKQILGWLKSQKLASVNPRTIQRALSGS